MIPLEDEARFVRTLRDGDAPVSAAETQMHYLPCGAQRGRSDYIAARTEQFHSAGFAHLGYFNPLLCVSYSEVYGPAREAGVLQTDPATGEPFSYPAFVGGDGPAGFTEEPLAQFDFTAPATEGFYEGLVREAYDAGYDGWMEDFGEYTPPTAGSADGTPGPAMHNRYPTDYHCAMRRIAARLERPLTRHQRSGWTGAARCANIVWGGDPTTRWGFDGLSSTITQGLGIGMSGVARWGSDIGGYFSFGAQGRPDAPEDPRLTPELLIRWIEVGAVSPVMRTKRSGIAIPSYTRPQVFDPEILPHWRRYTKLHTQLYPYLRAADAELPAHRDADHAPPPAHPPRRPPGDPRARPVHVRPGAAGGAGGRPGPDRAAGLRAPRAMAGLLARRALQARQRRVLAAPGEAALRGRRDSHAPGTARPAADADPGRVDAAAARARRRHPRRRTATSRASSISPIAAGACTCSPSRAGARGPASTRASDSSPASAAAPGPCGFAASCGAATGSRPPSPPCATRSARASCRARRRTSWRRRGGAMTGGKRVLRARFETQTRRAHGDGLPAAA